MEFIYFSFVFLFGLYFAVKKLTEWWDYAAGLFKGCALGRVKCVTEANCYGGISSHINHLISASIFFVFHLGLLSSITFVEAFFCFDICSSND